MADRHPSARRLAPRLVDIVPSSIKSMRLLWDRHGPLSLMLFDGFSDLQKETMPLLRIVIFTFDRSSFPTDDFQHLAHAFSNTSVELDVKAPIFGGVSRPYIRWDAAHLYRPWT